MPALPLLTGLDATRTIVVLAAVALMAGLDIAQRRSSKRSHLLFATVLGTILSFGLIEFTQVLLTPESSQNAHVMALGLILLVIGWHVLFGPWESSIKATVLGTFVFWVSYSILSHEDPSRRVLHLIAVAVALIPAFVWCALFLRYHSERISRVLMMFFGGMLSTVPILFYDALVRRGAELQFFLFRIVPESFNATSQSFVSGQLGVLPSVNQTILSTFISFLIVGLIEEGSKGWVVKRSGEAVFASINEALELSIIAAIGFAFAENIINPTYFMSFVRDYLLVPQTPDIAGFLSNVAGRAVLTSMVHIVSTGVMGYFLGRAVFAKSILAEAESQGSSLAILRELESIFRVPYTVFYRVAMLASGIVCAVLLHASFDFLVTFPDLLPGQPHTLGALFGRQGSFLDVFPLLLFPALFYVVGGFWLLTHLFESRENDEDRGHLVQVETFVHEPA